MKLALAMLLLASTTALAAVGDDSDPTNALPGVTPNANSYNLTRKFLQNEDADRFEQQFYDFVVDGCYHDIPTSSMIGDIPTNVCIAYVGGYRINDSTAEINYTAAGAASTDTCWVAVTAAQSGNYQNFVRYGASHYTIDCTSTSRPSAPTDGIIVMKVTTTGGSITAGTGVTDLRRQSPVVWYTLRANFSTRVLAESDYAYASDTSCLYIGDGATAGGLRVGCADPTSTNVPTCPSTVDITTDGSIDTPLLNLRACSGVGGTLHIYNGAGDEYVSLGNLTGLETYSLNFPPDAPTANGQYMAISDFNVANLVWADPPSAGAGGGCDIHVNVLDFAEDEQLLFFTKFARHCLYEANLAGSTVEGYLGGAFASSAITFTRIAAADCNPTDWNPVQWATATFPADTSITTAVLAGTETDFAIGDCMEIFAPTPQDFSLGGYSIWLKGTPQ